MRLWRSPRRWSSGATIPMQIRWKSHVSFPLSEGRWPSLIRRNRYPFMYASCKVSRPSAHRRTLQRPAIHRSSPDCTHWECKHTELLNHDANCVTSQLLKTFVTVNINTLNCRLGICQGFTVSKKTGALCLPVFPVFLQRCTKRWGGGGVSARPSLG